MDCLNVMHYVGCKPFVTTKGHLDDVVSVEVESRFGLPYCYCIMRAYWILGNLVNHFVSACGDGNFKLGCLVVLGCLVEHAVFESSCNSVRKTKAHSEESCKSRYGNPSVRCLNVLSRSCTCDTCSLM